MLAVRKFKAKFAVDSWRELLYVYLHKRCWFYFVYLLLVFPFPPSYYLCCQYVL